MPAGSDHEPTETVEVVEQMREATERLRDQAWMIAPLTTAAVNDGEARKVLTRARRLATAPMANPSDSGGAPAALAGEEFVCAGCGKPVRLRRDAHGAIRRADASAYRRDHATCAAAASATVARE